MHPYIPVTDAEKIEMLQKIGVSSIDDLFADIPKSLRLGRELELAPPKDEFEVKEVLTRLAAKNFSTAEHICFRGAGAYDHIIPSIIPYLISRSEFITAYTPYQAEMSQGTLQAIFEFQSMITSLTAMSTANASLYDGATATAEALFLMAHSSKRRKVALSKTVHPRWREVVETYAKFNHIEIVSIPEKSGITDFDALEKNLDSTLGGVILQSPNYFGNVEEIAPHVSKIKANKSLLTVCVNPLSLAVLTPPGEYGADIAVGEAQPFGLPLAFGGPYLGFMAVEEKLMRKIPGRICGESVDKEGKRAFTLTLQAREQHIRREKATSNICSNQSLCALTATIYMSLLGKNGLKETALENITRSTYLKTKLLGLKNVSLISEQFGFNEFALTLPTNVEAINKKLAEEGFTGPMSLEADYPQYKNGALFCATEKQTISQIDRFVKTLGEIL